MEQLTELGLIGQTGALAALTRGGLGADTIVGGEGSDALLHEAVLRGLLGDDALLCGGGADVILGAMDGRAGGDLNEIVTGGLGDDVLFGEPAGDMLNLGVQGSGWAGGGGEDVLVGAGEDALVTTAACGACGAWIDGLDGPEFAAVIDDIQAGGQMLWAGGGADSLDLSDLAA